MIKDKIDNALKEFNISGLPEAEQYQVVAQLTEHLNQVVLDTVLASLNEQQLKEFKDIISQEDPVKLEEQVALFVAKIPAIDLKLEEAVNDEIAHIKASKAILDQ